MLTTVTLIRFEQNKARAFAAMGLLPPRLKQVAGLRFAKMMGSGKGKAFSIMPDFSRYCLLGVWESSRHAEQFFSTNPNWLGYRAQAAGTAHIQLSPLSARGSWNGQQPFEHANQKPSLLEPVAVLTRASLRWSRLPSFWHHARRSTSEMPDQTAGLRYSLGIGEVPYVEQATFSIWENAEKMMAFVTAPAHLQAIKLRHQERWYQEELFARFTINSIQVDNPALFPGLEALATGVA